MCAVVGHLDVCTQRTIKALFRKRWDSAIRLHKDAIERAKYMKEVRDEFNRKRVRDSDDVKIIRKKSRML